MKIPFLIVILLTVAVVQSKQTVKEATLIMPCQQTASYSKYTDFVYKHLLIKKFDKHDEEKWEE